MGVGETWAFGGADGWLDCRVFLQDARAGVIVLTLRDTCAKALFVLDCFDLRQGLTVYPRLASNSWRFPYLGLANATIIGLCHHASGRNVVSGHLPVCLESSSVA